MSRANRRFYRTILLGVVAMAALVWVALGQFGISREQMSALFLGTVLVVVLAIASAALLVAAWMGLRRLLQRRKAG